MKIGFDSISVFGSSGIEMYTRSLIDAFKKSDLDIQMSLFTNSSRVSRVNNLFGISNKISVRNKLVHPLMLGEVGKSFIDLVKNRFLLPSASKEVDLFHFVNPFFFNKRIKNSVITVHDIFVFYDIYWVNANFPKKKKKFQQNFLDAFDTAKAIIVPTNTVKKELCDMFPEISPQRVFVTYEAAGPSFRQKEVDFTLLADYGILPQTKFFLFVSRFDPRKNYRNIITAFSLLPESMKKDYKLVFVGGERERITRKLYDFVSSSGISENFLHLNNVSLEVLVEAYNAARALVFPSFAEGFGLPLVEAMNCGCPIITSNASCMPEITGNAALLVNPEDTKEIRDKMLEIAENDDLYEKLKTAGLERSKMFSWEKCAEETYAAYEFALKQLSI